jgi:DNA mismatch repair protein MSH6
VDQAETAIGADLRRQDAGKGKEKAAKEPKIVHRELRQILTTGTIVDGQLLTDDLSNHCIAIKEYLADGDSDPRFGIVIADCSTAEFTMSAFQVCNPSLCMTSRALKDLLIGRYLPNTT